MRSALIRENQCSSIGPRGKGNASKRPSPDEDLVGGHTARAFGMKIMIGCMVSSSVTITAAAQLSPLVDYADLHGNLLIANDPYNGVKVVNGKLVFPDPPGRGLV